jgi:zinc protease
VPQAGSAAPASSAGSERAAPSPVIAVPPLAFTTRKLANGLTVYALRDTRSANVAVQMWYDVGSKDDPAGRSGFAHLFEHILSRVTRNIPHGELSRIVEEQAGGTRNASTGPAATMYRETVPARQLEAMIWAHAERMGRSVLDQAVFDTERNIVKEEMRQNVLSQPYGRLQRYYAFDTGFKSHPYRRSGIGTVADLDSASLEDARAFHENFYRPDNAVLVVSGNFDPKQLDAFVDEHLAPIPKPERPILRHSMKEAERTEARSLTAYGPNVPLPAIVYTYQRPRLAHPDSAALDVLGRILAAGESSRLYRSLVYDAQVSPNVSAMNYGLEDAGILTVQAVVATGKEPAEVERLLSAELARVRDAAVSEAELAEAKTEIVSELLFDRETPEGRASEIGTSLTRAQDPRFGDKHMAAVQKVTAADVRRAARKYLRDDRRVSIRYLDETARTGVASGDPSQLPTAKELGRTLPPATGTPNTLAPEGERLAPPAPGPQRPFTAPAFAERTLANGLRVVAARSTELPIAGLYLVFGGGTSADPDGRPGVASMTALLAESGAAGMSAPEIAARVESLGARLGFQAGPDSTLAFTSAPSANIAEAGALLSAVVRSPDFPAEELERERKQALDRLRVSMRQPAFVNALVAQRALYGDAPYGNPQGGTPASLAALTRDDVAGYARRWWRPDNATLIVTGGLESDAAFVLAERLFGDWAKPSEPLPQDTASPAGSAGVPRVIVVDMPAADQAAVSVALRAIPRKDEDYYPLLLANSVLGGSSTGRLFQEVRVKRALSYGAYSSLTALSDEGSLIAQARTRNDAAPEVAKVMLDEIRRLAAEPVSQDLLQRRKTLQTGAFARQVEGSGGLATFLAGLAVQGLPMSEYARYTAALEAVTPEAIAASVAGELDPSRASIVIVGKAEAFLEPLRAQYPNVEVVPLHVLDLGSAALKAQP